MNTHKRLALVPAAVVISLILTNINSAQAELVQINSKFQPDPLTVTGESGGTVKSNCGNITASPNQVIKVTEALPYLHITVEGAGQPTLLVEGPGGKFCVLPDKYSQHKPEISGFWQAGTYSVYVGDLSPGQHNYTLSISQQKK